MYSKQRNTSTVRGEEKETQGDTTREKKRKKSEARQRQLRVAKKAL